MNWIDVNNQLPPAGKKVIALVGGKWMAFAFYFPPGALDSSDWDDPPGEDDEEWDDNGDGIYNKVPMWEERPLESDNSFRLTGITHWMPRPPLPEPKGEQP